MSKANKGPKWGGQTFLLIRGWTNFFTLSGGGQTFSVGVDGGDDNVDGEKEEDVSEANTQASEASMLSAGARI